MSKGNGSDNRGLDGGFTDPVFDSQAIFAGVMQALSWMGANVGSYNKASLLKDLVTEGFSQAEALELQAAIARNERVIAASAPPVEARR